jgi:hypothetical protein
MDGRLRAAGLYPPQMRLGLAFEIPARERAERALTLLRAGYLGERNGGVSPSSEATTLLFDGLQRQLDTSVARGARIQWNFTDGEPWHLVIDNGSTSAAPGRVPDPDLVFRCSFEHWLDLASGRLEPWRALATGKIRPSGKLRMLVRARKLFA